MNNSKSSYIKNRPWLVLLASSSEQAQDRLLRKNLVASDDMFVPYTMMGAMSQVRELEEDGVSLRSALRRYIFIKADENGENALKMLSAEWNSMCEDKLFIITFGTKEDKKTRKLENIYARISEKDKERIEQACLDLQCFPDLPMPLEGFIVGQELRLTGTPFEKLSDKFTVLEIKHDPKIGAVHVRVAVKMFGFRLEKFYITFRDTDSYGDYTARIASYQKKLLDIFCHRVDWKNYTEALQAEDNRQLEDIAKSKIEIKGDGAMKRHYQALMLICAHLQTKEDEIENLTQEIKEHLKTISALRESKAATDTRAWLHVALFIATGEEKFRTMAKTYVSQHNPSSPNLRKFVATMSMYEATKVVGSSGRTTAKKTYNNMLISLDQFIANSVTRRSTSMFAEDIRKKNEALTLEIRNKKVCVIGGGGNIGSSFTKAVLRFRPKCLVVIDLNENALAELERDLRSANLLSAQCDFRCYALNFADPIFESIFREEKGFDIVANFSAQKSKRSERDRYSVKSLMQNNCIGVKHLMDLLTVYPPQHFFSLTTDDAAPPKNMVEASKRIMEDVMMAYSQQFKITSARLPQVAFSRGSLLDGWVLRLQKRQPLVAPAGVKRHFVSRLESGQICMLACILGRSGEVFFPRLKESDLRLLTRICDNFIKANGMTKAPCANDAEARSKASLLSRSSLTMSDDPIKYPTVYFKSGTTDEQVGEVFYSEGERIDNNRFKGISVIEQTDRRDMADVNTLIARLESIFQNPDFTTTEVEEAINGYIKTQENNE